MNPRPVSIPYTASCSGMKPIRRYSGGLSRTGSPSTVTSPSDGPASPAIMCNRVVLPAPLGPNRPVTPGPTCRDTSFTATTLPYHLDTARTSMVAPPWELKG